jgi:hypothetical protein
MIHLANILKEFEYGKQLFNDPSTITKVLRNTNKNDIDWMVPPRERDTEEEREFLQKLVGYMRAVSYYDDGSGTDLYGGSSILPVLKELLKLKRKFPQILDPASRLRYYPAAEIISNDHYYRGATISLETFHKLNWQYKPFRGGGIFVAEGQSKTLRPRSSRGFYSFSVEFAIANKVARKKMASKLYETRRMSCIIATRSNHRNMLFNPDFLAAIAGGLREQEVLYVGNTIPADFFAIPEGVIGYYASFIRNELENGAITSSRDKAIFDHILKLNAEAQ